MKTGDYVRTKKGTFDRFITSHTQENLTWYTFEDRGNITNPENYIIKSSPNIIDLFEEHDLVVIEYYSNRYKERVSRIFEVDFINKNRDVCFENGYCRLNMFYGEWSNRDKLLNPIIKSIVTREQFSQMEYKVKE